MVHVLSDEAKRFSSASWSKALQTQERTLFLKLLQ